MLERIIESCQQIFGMLARHHSRERQYTFVSMSGRLERASELTDVTRILVSCRCVGARKICFPIPARALGHAEISRTLRSAFLLDERATVAKQPNQM